MLLKPRVRADLESVFEQCYLAESGVAFSSNLQFLATFGIGKYLQAPERGLHRRLNGPTRTFGLGRYHM